VYGIVPPIADVFRNVVWPTVMGLGEAPKEDMLKPPTVEEFRMWMKR
jgi:hypothetical protein